MKGQGELSILFGEKQIERIKKRFNEHAQGGKMDLLHFKKSMGLLGIGECELLCDRIFRLITQANSFTSKEFISFLNLITHGDKVQKAKVSFSFIDRNKKGYISRDDIESIITEVLFAWNFLTGDKLSTNESIDLICNTLGIVGSKSVNFSEYLDVYDNYIEWFDYFNSTIKNVEQSKSPFNLNQCEEYLKLLHSEVKNMIQDIRESEDTHEDTTSHSLEISTINSVKGPVHLLAQEFKPRGDTDNPRESLSYFRASTLQRDMEVEGETKVEIVTKKLEQFQKISEKLFPQYHSEKQIVQLTGRSKKKENPNITEPERRKNIIYFGHQNWNLMLNMMLGIRKVLKSHFYKFNPNEEFSEQDLNCKYAHDLIYKQYNKSVKEVCELFAVYSPKVFNFIRCKFSLDNTQLLKSIGLENLVGNLLMGNLSTLTQQMSEGKSGSFIYYTEDSRIIVKEISHDECKKLREILSDYTDYIIENPDTFLPHIYGLFKLVNKFTNRHIYFIVVNNIFCTDLKINERYDIKGSTYNRQAKVSTDDSSNTALKDLDLMNNPNRAFNIEFQTREKIFNQIVKDSTFLAEHNIIEYSLLVGIHKGSEDVEGETRAFGSSNGRELYFFGIIDILTEYSAKKVVENHFMHMFVSDISCMAPKDYNQRFKDFIYKYIFGT